MRCMRWVASIGGVCSPNGGPSDPVRGRASPATAKPVDSANWIVCPVVATNIGLPAGRLAASLGCIKLERSLSVIRALRYKT